MSLITRCISAGRTIVLGATDGTETLAKASEVFPGWVDPDFLNWGLDVPDSATPETPVVVEEMAEDGTFRQVFEGFGLPLDQLCMTQSQIKKFCAKHRAELRTGGFGTFFLLKKKVCEGNEEVGISPQFFVAGVHIDDLGRLWVGVSGFDNGNVWNARNRYRIVVPKQ